jgi:hypothetical protein
MKSKSGSKPRLVAGELKQHLEDLELRLNELEGIARTIEGKLDMLCELLNDKESEDDEEEDEGFSDNSEK